MLQTEVFEANEYIAACYTGVCDISGEVFFGLERQRCV